jgi:hypothetical protein
MARTAEMQTKSLGAFEIKDEAEGLVEAIVATLNVVDHDGDVILPGAIQNGSTVKLSSYAHDVVTAGAAPVGLATVDVVGNQAILKGRFFMNTQRGREAFETVKALGAEGEWSIGFRPTKTAPVTKAWRERGASRLLASIALVETSPVFVGASPNTGTLGVKSAQADGDDTEGEPPVIDEELKSIVADVYARREAEKKAAADAAAEAERKEAEEKAALEAKALAEAAEAKRIAELEIVQRIHDRFVRNMRRAS